MRLGVHGVFDPAFGTLALRKSVGGEFRVYRAHVTSRAEMTEHTTAPARPSATVVLFREPKPGAAEILLVQRSGRLDFHGGAWVFPGGRVDAAEEAAAAGDSLAAARAAAVREVAEETRLTIPADTLVPISRWTTPVEAPKRFVTWFFLAPLAGGSEVTVDGQEIVASRWLSPAQAIAEHRSGALEIPPPTFVTLFSLDQAGSISSCHRESLSREPDIFEPKIVVVGKAFFSLYAGDAGFSTGDKDVPGSRHRLWSTPAGWHYERSNDPSGSE
jgi:8-oxo-dGTP pyrophosphatase MutT (NUDIX family)